MSRHHFTRLPSRRILIGLVLALLLLGTAFQATFAAETSLQGASPTLRFPRLIFHVDQNGTVEALGVMTAADTETRLSGASLDALSSMLGLNLQMQMFNAATMSALTEANIQHVEIQTSPEGLALYGNSEFLVGVEWGDEATLTKIVRLAEVARNVEFPIPVASLMTGIGVDVLVALPTPAGAEPIAPRPFDSGVEFPAAGEGAQPALTLNLAGEYTADGTPVMLGASLADWGTLLGMDLSILNLTQGDLELFQEAGIQSLGVGLNGDGVSVLISEEPLATVVLGEQESLGVAAQLAEQFEIPFAGLIPKAGQTGKFDIDITVALP